MEARGPGRDEARIAARDALAMIERYRRGEVDGLTLCRTLVDDESLREIVPIPLLLGFIGVESQFDRSPDDETDPVALADRRAERDEVLAEEGALLARDCDALVAHLERWQHEHPIRSDVRP